MAKKVHFCFISREISLPAVARLLGLQFDSEQKAAKKGKQVICRFQKAGYGKMIHCVSLSNAPRNEDLIETLEEDSAGRFEEITSPARSKPALLKREEEMGVRV